MSQGFQALHQLTGQPRWLQPSQELLRVTAACPTRYLGGVGRSARTAAPGASEYLHL